MKSQKQLNSATKKTDYFKEARATAIKLQNQHKQRRCGKWRPCKRMECVGCVERRLDYFLRATTFLINKHGIDCHCTISLPLSENDDVWLRLQSLSAILTEKLTGRIGPFVRILALGKEKGTPHVHYLIQEKYFKAFESVAKKSSPKKTRISQKEIYGIHGLLEYLFISNFLPTDTHPDKIKGIRLISGSRGITYGYPRKKHWKHLELMTLKNTFVDNSGRDL